MKFIPIACAVLAFFAMIGSVYDHQMNLAGAWASAWLGWMSLTFRIWDEA